jgi:hypothetical protein
MASLETVPYSSVSRRRPKRPKSKQRSRIGNGSALLPGIDGRSLLARRYGEISLAILIDQGGIEACSEARQQLIRRFSASAVLAEQMEAKLANGEQIDINEHAKLVSTMVRVAKRIGIDRIARNITPTIDQYLRDNTLEAAE